MNDTEVLELSPNNLPAALLKTTVKERQNIADIIRDYGHRLQGFIRKRVKSTEDAEDILQEVYFQLAEADRLLKPIDQMAAWLFTVARNRITDLYRKKKTASLTEFFGSDEDEHSISEIKELIFDNGTDPETEYLRSLVWTELEDVLNELPEEQRLVFELTELKGLSFKEISQQTGVPVNTLISRKRYAVLVLRERFQQIYNEGLTLDICGR